MISSLLSRIPVKIIKCKDLALVPPKGSCKIRPWLCLCFSSLSLARSPAHPVLTCGSQDTRSTPGDTEPRIIQSFNLGILSPRCYVSHTPFLEGFIGKIALQKVLLRSLYCSLVFQFLCNVLYLSLLDLRLYIHIYAFVYLFILLLYLNFTRTRTVFPIMLTEKYDIV